MHRLNVLIYASNSFVSTLNELRPFLKFNHFTSAPKTGYDIILFHDEVLKDKKIKNLIEKSDFLTEIIFEILNNIVFALQLDPKLELKNK